MKCYVQTAKFGDIISILPILHDEWRRTGEKPALVVSKQYAVAFTTIDYIQLCVYDGDWQDVFGAIKFAKQNFAEVIIPQTHGNGYNPERKRASFQLDQWDRCGAYDKWDTLPMILPRPANASELVKRHLGKPSILYADHSESSPFDRSDELYESLTKTFPDHKIVRLSSIRFPNLLDVLALYDAAQLIVTIETVFLHLLHATDTPGIALATDKPSKWHGSAGSMKFAFYTHYDEFDKHLPFLLKKSQSVIGRKKMWNKRWCIRRTAAIGDVIAASIVAKRMNELGYETEYQAHRDTHPVLRRIDGITLSDGKEGYAQIDLDGAYENDPDRAKKHFHQMFLGEANRRLAFYGKGIGNEFNCRPVLRVADADKETARKVLEGHRRPWVFACPRSDSHLARTVRDQTWSRAAAKINGTCFWIGRHAAPEYFIDLKCRTIDDVTKFLSVADLLISVDTGPAHIAIALGIPSIIIGQSSDPELHFSDKADWLSIYPRAA